MCTKINGINIFLFALFLLFTFYLFHCQPHASLSIKMINICVTSRCMCVCVLCTYALIIFIINENILMLLESRTHKKKKIKWRCENGQKRTTEVCRSEVIWVTKYYNFPFKKNSNKNKKKTYFFHSFTILQFKTGFKP